MLFVDMRNLTADERASRLREQGWEIDFLALARALAGRRNLVRGVVFYAAVHRDGSPRGRRLLDALGQMGFEVHAQGYDHGENGAQKQVDVALALALVKRADHHAYDTAILVSGDQDFVPAVHYVRNLGLRVEAAAWDESASSQLRRSVDRSDPLNQVPCIRLRRSPSYELH